MITFLIVGSVNTLFGYGLYCLFLLIGCNHLLAITFSFLIGVLFSFQTIGRFVFRAHNPKLLTKFILLYVFLYCLNLILLENLKHFSDNWYLNGAITTVVAAAISFTLNKLWVFKT